METFETEEVKKILQMLNSINDKVRKVKGAEPTKLEKQIRYLEQRLKFFNPTKEILAYIISLAEISKLKLDPILLEKLKKEFEKKTSTL